MNANRHDVQTTDEQDAQTDAKFRGIQLTYAVIGCIKPIGLDILLWIGIVTFSKQFLVFIRLDLTLSKYVHRLIEWVAIFIYTNTFKMNLSLTCQCVHHRL